MASPAAPSACEPPPPPLASRALRDAAGAWGRADELTLLPGPGCRGAAGLPCAAKSGSIGPCEGFCWLVGEVAGGWGGAAASPRTAGRRCVGSGPVVVGGWLRKLSLGWGVGGASTAQLAFLGTKVCVVQNVTAGRLGGSRACIGAWHAYHAAAEAGSGEWAEV
jgi:hypothetical protein